MFSFDRIVRLGLLVAGIINLLPVSGVLGRTWLESLYGFSVALPDLEILLRHRAILFALLGGLLIGSIFRPAIRTIAVIAGVISMASFIVMALLVGNWGPPIRTVMIVDVVGLLALLPALMATLRKSGQAGDGA